MKIVEAWHGPGRRDGEITPVGPEGNAAHLDDHKLAFEHWYFDARLDDGHIVVGFIQTKELIQRKPGDANEVANAFTYGGNTITQYPMTVYPREVVTGLTLLIPLAFVNWYPALYVLDRPDPFGYPDWLRFASPVAAIVLMSIALLVWRTGVRHYASTGS